MKRREFLQSAASCAAALVVPWSFGRDGADATFEVPTMDLGNLHGAFDDSIPVLLAHSVDEPPIGVVLETEPTDTGVRVSIRIRDRKVREAVQADPDWFALSWMVHVLQVDVDTTPSGAAKGDPRCIESELLHWAIVPASTIREEPFAPLTIRQALEEHESTPPLSAELWERCGRGLPPLRVLAAKVEFPL